MKSLRQLLNKKNWLLFSLHVYVAIHVWRQWAETSFYGELGTVLSAVWRNPSLEKRCLKSSAQSPVLPLCKCCTAHSALPPVPIFLLLEVTPCAGQKVDKGSRCLGQLWWVGSCWYLLNCCRICILQSSVLAAHSAHTNLTDVIFSVQPWQ